MHRNYYTFAAQVAYLNTRLTGGHIAACFTHRKNELVLEIEAEKSYNLRISIDAQKPYILLYPHQNIKDHTIDFFTSIISQNINRLELDLCDKIVRIRTGSDNIIARFYGKSANIYLEDRDGKIRGSFKHRQTILPAEAAFNKLAIDSTLDDKLLLTASENPNLILENIISTLIAGFDKLLSREVLFRSGLEPGQKIKNLTV